MKICSNCEVLVEDDVERCPLCGNQLHDVSEAGGSAGSAGAGPVSVPGSPKRGSRSPEAEREPGEAEGEADSVEATERTVKSAKFWLFEVISLVAFTAALVVFAADFAYGFGVTWSRIPLLAIAFVWFLGSAAIGFSRHPIVLLVLETAIIAGFLLVLSVLSGSGEWFVPLALPITLLVGLLVGLSVGAIIRLRLSVFQTIAVIFLASGLFLVGLEAIINNSAGSESIVSWSLVAFACTFALFVLLLFVNRRLKLRHQEFRKVFHI